MARDEERTRRESMRHPDQKESQLASTREDATLAEQVLGDSPHPDARRDFEERHGRRESEELGHS